MSQQVRVTSTGVLLTLADGRTMRQCLACAIGEHEDHWNDPEVCNGCAICLSTATP